MATTAVATTDAWSHGLAELDTPQAALIRMADGALDSRIVTLLPGALELTCALMQHGHSTVTMARLTDHPRAGEADILIVPDVMTAGFLDLTMPYARRVLAPLGTLVLSLNAGLPAEAARHACCRLRQLGFAGLHTEVSCGNTLVRADLPLIERPSCA